MANIKKIGTAAGTFGVALGIGFIMQNGDALASRFGAEAATDQPAPFTETDITDVQSVSAQSETLNAILQPEAPAVEPAQAAIVFSEAPVVIEPALTKQTAVVLPEALKMPVSQDAPIQLVAFDPETTLAFEVETSPAAEPEVLPEVEVEATPEPVIEPEEVITTEIDCVPMMSVASDVAAMVSLSVSAPCHTSQAFTVHHQGMMFTAMTDADGAAELIVPALAEVSVMIAAFENGDGAVATATINDFTDYDRAVLQWQGDTSVMLSAYEGNASFDDDNHIHAGNPGNMARLVAAQGGYLVRLGDETVDDALIAEIYTFPTGTIGDAPDVMLIAEAEITAGNCGKELNAQSIQVAPSGQTSALDLTMTMPDCDAVGDVLILQNMFEDLTLASR